MDTFLKALVQLSRLFLVSCPCRGGRVADDKVTVSEIGSNLFLQYLIFIYIEFDSHHLVFKNFRFSSIFPHTEHAPFLFFNYSNVAVFPRNLLSV